MINALLESTPNSINAELTEIINAIFKILWLVGEFLFILLELVLSFYIIAAIVTKLNFSRGRVLVKLMHVYRKKKNEIMILFAIWFAISSLLLMFNSGLVTLELLIK